MDGRWQEGNSEGSSATAQESAGGWEGGALHGVDERVNGGRWERSGGPVSGGQWGQGIQTKGNVVTGLRPMSCEALQCRGLGPTLGSSGEGKRNEERVNAAFTIQKTIQRTHNHSDQLIRTRYLSRTVQRGRL